MTTISSRIKYKCPNCESTYTTYGYGSYNTFGATVWSDDYMEAPYYPAFNLLVFCPVCKKYYFISSLEFVGEYPFELFPLLTPSEKELCERDDSQTERDTSWIEEILNRPRLEDVYGFDRLKLALSQFEEDGFPSLNDELSLRRAYLQNYNSKYGRKDNSKASKKEKREFRKNAYRLITVLKLVIEDLIASRDFDEPVKRNLQFKVKAQTAEYLREIGEFDKSQAILDTIDTTNLKKSEISYIDAIAHANNRSLIKVFEVRY